MHKLLLACLLSFCLLSSSKSAYADPVSYSFAFGDALAGTRLVYVTADGFLSFSPTVLVPTYATDVTVNGNDRGPLMGFEVGSPTSLSIFSPGYSLTFASNTYSLTTFGVQQISNPVTVLANLTITRGNILDPVAATPEPASFVLTGSALLGMAGVVTVRGRRLSR